MVDEREITLLVALEKSRKAYQVALIDLRLAEDLIRELHNSDGLYQLTAARDRFSTASHNFQDALRAFSEFTLSQGERPAENAAL